MQQRRGRRELTLAALVPRGARVSKRSRCAPAGEKSICLATRSDALPLLAPCRGKCLRGSAPPSSPERPRKRPLLLRPQPSPKDKAPFRPWRRRRGSWFRRQGSILADAPALDRLRKRTLEPGRKRVAGRKRVRACGKALPWSSPRAGDRRLLSRGKRSARSRRAEDPARRFGNDGLHWPRRDRSQRFPSGRGPAVRPDLRSLLGVKE
jgi:hypothetical protein